MPRGVKKRDFEDLSDSNIRKVISLLNADNPITKKEACEILKISYNTSRLSKIIEEYNSSQEFTRRMKQKKRGKPADKAEISNIVEEYLQGASFGDIAKRNYRSLAFVKAIVERVGVPQRATGDDVYKIEYLPEECTAEEFVEGEIAWSAKYHSSCTVRKRLEDWYIEKYGCPVYRVYINEDSDEVFTKGGFFAVAPAYDLGKLSHLEEYGVNIARL